MLYNYGFVIDGVLAGCAMPGLGSALLEDLQEAQDAGITAVVSLTEMPLPASVLGELGLKYLHLPVQDFTAPGLNQIEEFVSFVNDIRQQEGAVLVHCHGGYGRTGTMLAAYLVHEGMSSREAIETIRRSRPGSIETGSQETIIRSYESRLRNSKK